MEDQRPKKNELDKKFLIEEMYGTIGAYPGGIGATLVLAHVFITYTPATQVPSSLESSASRSQSLEETFSKILLVPLLLRLLFLLMRSLVTSGSSETTRCMQK